ncbi:MAG TPA: hypothetical protein VGO02_05175 [Burkholderiales bacterium]|nr:hypothetical protein [Burkholderiales bacterium]
MTIVEWAQFTAIAVCGAFGLFCLFEGTRRLAAHDPRGRASNLVGIGVVVVGMLAGYAYWQHWTYADVARSYQPAETVHELPTDFGKKMSPAKREAASRSAARGTFITSGKLTQYVDASGQRKLYPPVQDDIKHREDVLATASRLERKASESFVEFILWLILGLSAVVFGLCFAFEPAAKRADSEADLEAQPPA